MSEHAATAPHRLERRALLAAVGAGTAAAPSGVAQAQAVVPPPGGTAAAPAPPASSAAAARAVEAHRDPILRISREVWATPEVSLAEARSHAVHLRALEAAGFRVLSRGAAGVPTAFVAEWGQGRGGPAVGFLPEYDALPGLGNAAEPRQAPGPGGAGAPGHGCGHNMLGAGCTGAAIALKAMMEADGTAGTIRVFGCAGEEAEGAKVYMAREGHFGGLAAALAWHPAPVAGSGLVRLAATDKAKVAFRGRTAHAGNAPWEGRSALKAAELFGVGVQMMREHVAPTARVHYVYEHAGVAPNVVPDFAQVWIVVRELDRARVGALTDWVRQVAEGAATATQTRAEVEVFFGTHDLLPNEPLARRLHAHLSAVPLDWGEDEQSFARACQRAMGVPEAGMATRPLPFVEAASAGAATDVGDVSHLAPTGVFLWPTLPLGIGLHTWPVTACAGGPIGDRASLATARILAACGHDLMTDGALREAAAEDHRRRRAGLGPYASPLPEGRTRPLGLPPHLAKTGDDEIASALAGS